MCTLSISTSTSCDRRRAVDRLQSIKLGKMAKLMSMSVEELKELLMGYKDMCQTMTWNEAAGSDLLGGENISTAEVEVRPDGRQCASRGGSGWPVMTTTDAVSRAP